MVATAAWVSRLLAERRFDLAFNFGLAGSFRTSLHPGTVVHVVSDRLTELGAEDDESFLTIHELKLLGEDEEPFEGGSIVNRNPPPSISRLQDANGITVNTVHGNMESIGSIVSRHDPDVESMEGAAFMYACAIAGVQYAQVRAVSNMVERRNRAAWRVSEAIHALGRTAIEILGRV